MDENFLSDIFWSVIKQNWWIFLILFLVYALFSILPLIIKQKQKNKKFDNINKIHSDREIIIKLRKLNPKEFEDYVSFLFSKLGFDTESVGRAYDGGIDVIAKKDGVKHYIQCKKFISSKVSVSDVRDFYGALIDKLSKGKGYFVTTNKFTLEAEKFAQTKPIELIDSYKLLDYIKLAEIDNEKYFKNHTNKCPMCNGYLILREGNYGKFYGCSNYPKCKYTKKS
ncbi:MAG: restriction endonuclease [Patescibacteria group bacterium]|jgi:restriction system protein|nr:restriction endonuclease [Patescibacteria group bacterium]